MKKLRNREGFLVFTVFLAAFVQPVTSQVPKASEPDVIESTTRYGKKYRMFRVLSENERANAGNQLKGAIQYGDDSVVQRSERRIARLDETERIFGQLSKFEREFLRKNRNNIGWYDVRKDKTGSPYISALCADSYEAMVHQRHVDMEELLNEVKYLKKLDFLDLSVGKSGKEFEMPDTVKYFYPPGDASDYYIAGIKGVKSVELLDLSYCENVSGSVIDSFGNDYSIMYLSIRYDILREKHIKRLLEMNSFLGIHLRGDDGLRLLSREMLEKSVNSGDVSRLLNEENEVELKL